ncbi:helix-turn-helix domain-containing protein [Oxalobacteraceae bacterium]|nr:helix-turn-helix domain-containing protein [Oxalobacteraceae bacterium]
MSSAPIDTPLRHKLRELRAMRNMSQKDLSLRCGCSTGYLSRIESGLCAPVNSPLLARIADVLELDEEERVALVTAAKKSRTIVQLPTTGSWKGYAGIHELIRLLPFIDDSAWADIEQTVLHATERERNSYKRNVN